MYLIVTVGGSRGFALTLGTPRLLVRVRGNRRELNLDSVRQRPEQTSLTRGSVFIPF